MMRQIRALPTVLLAATLLANGDDLNSWQNLTRIAPNQPVELWKTTGESVKGDFSGFLEDSVELRVYQRQVSIPRSQVSRIKLQNSNRKALWIGLALGAGAGAGIGAGIGSGLSNESGGDFSNLTPAVIAVCAGVGALAGFTIGSVLSNRHRTIYQRK